MSADPLVRLLPAFGDVLVRRRDQRKLTVDALASAARLSVAEVKGLERGDYGPTLKDVFRLASALCEEPLMLLVDVVHAWRSDPTDTLHQSRSSDFARLFRLGYHRKPGDFRELPTAYYSVAESTHAAGKLNAQRHTRGVALLDTVCVYVRLDSVGLRPDKGQVEGREP
jgi:transcriptional regulator with XRE-family HTH domain